MNPPTLEADSVDWESLIPEQLLLSEPIQRMLALIQGNVALQAVYVATKLGIADRLEAGPRSCEDLAKACRCNADMLYRMLRYLCRFGVFSEPEPRYFASTPLADTLRDQPGSLRDLTLFSGEEFYVAWGNFLQTLYTEYSAFEATYGMNRCDYLASNPAKEKRFDAGTQLGAHVYVPALAAAYDFSSIETLVDVGKGDREYLPAILRRYPSVRGILVEKPKLVEETRGKMAEAGLAERCEIVAGSHLEPPPLGDGYLISNIQRMDDGEARHVMAQCRQVMADDGRLFVIERWVSAKLPPIILSEDLGLTVQTTGGRLRSLEEFRNLLEASGFTVNQVIPVDATRGILEAKPRAPA
jgi:hypothetical protein